METVKTFFQLKETAVSITSESAFLNDVAIASIFESRRIIESYINFDPFFKITLEPYDLQENMHGLIKKMCIASSIFFVGPMATVAGAIAQYAVDRMAENSANYALADNGGDIALFSKKKDITVGIYSGIPETSSFAIVITPESGIRGICTSSGKIGPSLSFGNVDAVTILAENAIIADAAATAVANTIKQDEDIKNAFKMLDGVREVKGAIAIIGKKIGLWGEVPDIYLARVQKEKITMRWY